MIAIFTYLMEEYREDEAVQRKVKRVHRNEKFHLGSKRNFLHVIGSQSFEQVTQKDCVISILDCIKKLMPQSSEQPDLVVLALSQGPDDHQKQLPNYIFSLILDYRKIISRLVILWFVYNRLNSVGLHLHLTITQ